VVTLPPWPSAVVNLVDMDGARGERPPTPVKVPGTSGPRGCRESMLHEGFAGDRCMDGPCDWSLPWRRKGLARSEVRYMLAQAKVSSQVLDGCWAPSWKRGEGGVGLEPT
jgi:hypothetical protein